MTDTAHPVRRLRADPITGAEHALEPWENRCHALADVPDFHTLINTEEKRRGTDSLGAELVGKLTDDERWIVAFAKLAWHKRLLVPEELARKMDAVAARYTAA